MPILKQSKNPERKGGLQKKKGAANRGGNRRNRGKIGKKKYNMEILILLTRAY